MLAAAAACLLTIAVLAMLTANPVTINRAQLLDSDLVVVGRVTRISATGVGEVTIENVLRGVDVPETLRVAHLPEVVRAGGRYLLPLRRRGTRFEITPAPAHAEKTWLVYPAREDVLRVAETLLETRTARPYP